jgi:hypothetical protein
MTSQPSQGTKLSSQELNNLVSDTVLYILSQDHTKYPIKRLDIVKNVLKTYGRHYKLVMDEAVHVLKEVSLCLLLPAKSNSD